MISFGQITYVLVIALALSGFCLSYYINHKKKKQAPLVCPLDGSCEEVIQSKYSIFLGVPLTLLGIIYYSFTAILYLSLFLSIIPYTPFVSFCVTMFSLGAFLFSMYLISVQAFVLHKWCTWCVISAVFSTIIAVGSAYIAHQTFVPFLITQMQTITILFTIFTAIGVGATTVLDVMFFKALKDNRISEEEVDNFHTFSQILWFALGFMVLASAMIYIGDSYVAGHSAIFVVKGLIILVIAINAIVLNLIISPRLTSISFADKHDNYPRSLVWIRHLAFATGAISMVSWYGILILSLIFVVQLSFVKLVTIYGVVAFCAIILSQIIELYFSWKKKRSPSNS